MHVVINAIDKWTLLFQVLLFGHYIVNCVAIRLHGEFLGEIDQNNRLRLERGGGVPLLTGP